MDESQNASSSHVSSAEVARDQSGEEAFQRRLALSGMATTLPVAPSPQPFEDKQASAPSYQAAPLPAESGDEAYLRRVALAQAQFNQPPPPLSVPSPPFTEVDDTPSTLAYNPFAPPSVPPPPPGPPGMSSALEGRVKAAAAIAARLGALAASAGGDSGSPYGSGSPAPGATHGQEEDTAKK